MHIIVRKYVFMCGNIKWFFFLFARNPPQWCNTHMVGNFIALLHWHEEELPKKNDINHSTKEWHLLQLYVWFWVYCHRMSTMVSSWKIQWIKITHAAKWTDFEKKPINSNGHHFILTTRNIHKLYGNFRFFLPFDFFSSICYCSSSDVRPLFFCCFFFHTRLSMCVYRSADIHRSRNKK